MKRTVLFLTCFCFFTLFVLADPVDQKHALQIAKEFVPQSSAAKKAPGKGSATPTSNIVYTHKMPKSGRDAFYIVNVGDAFVLVSADDIAHQILDKVSEGKLLPTYPAIPWKKVMGIRDIMAHHYFEVDADVVYEVISKELEPLKKAVLFFKEQLLD